MTLKTFSSLALCCGLVVCIALPAGAGGLYIAEFATADMGTAGAGAQARAGDAATAVSNAAGMTYLDDHQLQLGAAPGYGLIKFDQDKDTPVPGNNGGNQGGLFPLLGASYVHKLSDRVRLGFAVISVSGASLDPRSDWAGRTELQELNLLTFTFLPTLAVRVTDWLSLGAGPAITYATLDWKVQGPLGGKIKLDSFDDVKAAANISAMLQPLPELRFGLVFQSKTDLKLDGKIKNQLSEPVNTKLGLPLATAVRGEFWWDVTPKIALMAGAAWEDWSEADQVPLSTSAGSTKVKLGMKDTWKLRGGVHYKLSDEWTLQTGVSYDSSPVGKKHRIAALPLDEQLRVSVGAIHQLNDTLQLSTAFQWTNLGSSKLNNSSVKGKYQNNEVFFLMFNLNFKKLPWSGKGTF
jgi:long-chain fatty acid transport protein